MQRLALPPTDEEWNDALDSLWTRLGHYELKKTTEHARSMEKSNYILVSAKDRKAAFEGDFNEILKNIPTGGTRNSAS